MLYLFPLFFILLPASWLLLKYSRVTGNTLVFLALIYPLFLLCGSPAFFFFFSHPDFLLFLSLFLNPRCVISKGDCGLDIKNRQKMGWARTRGGDGDGDDEIKPRGIYVHGERSEEIRDAQQSDGRKRLFLLARGAEKMGGMWSVSASGRRGGGFLAYPGWFMWASA